MTPFPPSLSGMSRDNTCCFTGHRRIADGLREAVIRQTEHAVRILIHAGYRYFLCGGALGYDMLAEDVVLRAAQSQPDVRLVLALPCRDQTRRWMNAPGETVEALREYQRLKSAAAAVLYVTDFYQDGCMKERNAFMVEHASFCVAYYSGSVRSGTGQTVRMAEKEGLKIYNVYPLVTGHRDRTEESETSGSD